MYDFFNELNIPRRITMTKKQFPVYYILAYIIFRLSEINVRLYTYLSTKNL